MTADNRQMDAVKRLGIEVTKLVLRTLRQTRGFTRAEQAQIGRHALLSAYVSFLHYCGGSESKIAAQLREDADRVESGPDERWLEVIPSGKEADPS